MKSWVVWDLENTLLQISGPLGLGAAREMPGARKALHALHGKIAMGLAVSDEGVDGDKVRGFLEKVDLASFVKNIFCPSEIGCVKEHPDFFLAVAQALHASPDRVVWVDDSLKAVEEACRAGFRGVWFNPSTPDNHVGERMTTVHKLEAMEGVLMGWGLIAR